VARHAELLVAIRDAITCRWDIEYVIGWCLAGASESELEDLLTALREFHDKIPTELLVDLVLERYGQPSRLD
jgi:hypothetical protein